MLVKYKDPCNLFGHVESHCAKHAIHDDLFVRQLEKKSTYCNLPIEYLLETTYAISPYMYLREHQPLFLEHAATLRTFSQIY